VVQCVLCVGITIRGSLQRIYNPANPKTINIECLFSNQNLIEQGVTWTRNGMNVSNSNPLILDGDMLGDYPQQHEGKYRCVHKSAQSTEVFVYGEL